MAREKTEKNRELTLVLALNYSARWEIVQAVKKIAAEIEAGNNLIRISLANGFSKSLPFDYQTTKIHFGYVARF